MFFDVSRRRVSYDVHNFIQQKSNDFFQIFFEGIKIGLEFWGIMSHSTAKIRWRLQAFMGAPSSVVSVTSGHLGRITDLPQASWKDLSHDSVDERGNVTFSLCIVCTRSNSHIGM